MKSNASIKIGHKYNSKTAPIKGVVRQWKIYYGLYLYIAYVFLYPRGIFWLQTLRPLNALPILLDI